MDLSQNYYIRKMLNIDYKGEVPGKAAVAESLKIHLVCIDFYLKN